MARVDVTLNGRSYPIACEDGQEERVMAAAADLEERLAAIRGQAVGASDAHLLAMAGLTLIDELRGLRRVANGEAPPPDAADGLARVAERIEAIAARLNQA